MTTDRSLKMHAWLPESVCGATYNNGDSFGGRMGRDLACWRTMIQLSSLDVSFG